jgi:hypothetical protein
MALVLTQSLTEMSTRNISWGKDGRRVRVTSYHLQVPIVIITDSLNLLERSVPLKGLLYLFFLIT